MHERFAEIFAYLRCMRKISTTGYESGSFHTPERNSILLEKQAIARKAWFQSRKF